MLSKEKLQANEQLANLTDEQITAIVTLSKNDEDAVIAAKTSDFWKGIDKDVKEATGLDKPATQKSYDFLKEQLALVKDSSSKLSDLQSTIDTQKTKIQDLEQTVASGSGDAELKRQLADAKQQLADEQERAKNLETSLQTKQAEHQKELDARDEKQTALQVDQIFNAAIQGVKFQPAAESFKDRLIATAKQAVLAKGNPEFQTIDGKATAILRDPNNNDLPIPNPKNLQKPFTLGELLLAELGDVLQEGKKKAGAGGGKVGSGGNTANLDPTEWKTRTDANRAIDEYLHGQEGLSVKGTEFQAEKSKLWKEYNVSELPID